MPTYSLFFNFSFLSYQSKRPTPFPSLNEPTKILIQSANHQTTLHVVDRMITITITTNKQIFEPSDLKQPAQLITHGKPIPIIPVNNFTTPTIMYVVLPAAK